MRSLVLVALPFVLVAASEPAEQPGTASALNNPAYITPPDRWQSVEEAIANGSVPIDVINPQTCRDRITEAREASGQPLLLNREPASPDKPLAIYAVDRQQDGCSVMVMMGNRDDIRQLPLPAEGTIQIIPAEKPQ